MSSLAVATAAENTKKIPYVMRPWLRVLFRLANCTSLHPVGFQWFGSYAHEHMTVGRYGKEK